MSTITEREILSLNSVAINVATCGGAASQVVDWVSKQKLQPVRLDYLISGQFITVPAAFVLSVSALEQLSNTIISPMWLGRTKKRIKELAQLPVNWDSYGALPVDPRIPPLVEHLVEWFAVDDMPPPDVFATTEGGLQLEWHIRRVNIEIELSPFEETTIRFHDLNVGEPWSRAASSVDLQAIRRRLLAPYE